MDQLPCSTQCYFISISISISISNININNSTFFPSTVHSSRSCLPLHRRRRHHRRTFHPIGISAPILSTLRRRTPSSRSCNRIHSTRIGGNLPMQGSSLCIIISIVM
jgi:hypothetical protein